MSNPPLVNIHGLTVGVGSKEEAAAINAVQAALDAPAVYGEKYAGLRSEIIGNAEDAAKQFTALSAKYRGMADKYDELADKTRAAGIQAADNHIRDLERLDRAVAALNDPEDASSATAPEA